MWTNNGQAGSKPKVSFADDRGVSRKSLLVQLYATNREEFLPRHIAMPKNGFDASPAVLLKQFLNIDLLYGSLLSDDLALLNRRMDQLEPGAPH